MVTIRRTLKGMKEISAYVQLSDATVLGLILTAEFPARKTRGDAGIWISNTAAIDSWSEKFSSLDNGKSKTRRHA